MFSKMKIDEFDSQDQVFQNIKNRLLLQKQAGKEMILNLHIPGTGGRIHSQFPTHIPLEKLDEAGKPVLFFDALFSAEIFEEHDPEKEQFIPVSQRAANSFTPKHIHLKDQFKSLFQVSTASTFDDLGEGFGRLAPYTELVLGTGIIKNDKQLINALYKLQKENCLPDTIFLSGHSRGAINDISMLNALYINFPQLKVHACLTDPVPGPGHSLNQYWHEKVVPPNVVSFTVFYATDEQSTFLEANDLNKLIFTNPNTTVTTYGIPKTNHGSVLADPLLNDAIQRITYAVNDMTIHPRDLPEPIPTSEMRCEKGPRKGSQFFKRTSCNEECSTLLQQTLKTVRKNTEEGYHSSDDKEIKPFKVINFATKEEREKFLQDAYKNKVSSFALKSYNFFTGHDQPSLAYVQVMDIKQRLYASLSPTPIEDAELLKERVDYLDEHNHKKTGYIKDKFQLNQLGLISRTEKQYGNDPKSPAWEETLSLLQAFPSDVLYVNNAHRI